MAAVLKTIRLLFHVKGNTHPPLEHLERATVAWAGDGSIEDRRVDIGEGKICGERMLGKVNKRPEVETRSG